MLLGQRYKKDFLLNRYKAGRIKWNADNLQTASHSHCPICGAKKAGVIAEVDRIGFPCDTVICNQCQFVFNDSYIANPTEFYSQEWATERWVNPEESFLRRSAPDAYAWKRLAFIGQTIGSEVYGGIGSVLEVGCGDGCNLLPHHLMGKKVTGCDFDDRFLQPGRERGMELMQGDINAVSLERSFDLIMLIHSFEHVVDLFDSIDQVKQRLDVGGMVYVEVPGLLNWNRPRRRAIQDMGLRSSNNFLNYLQLQHNYHFDLGHLGFLWEQAGFDMIYGDEWVRALFVKSSNDDKDKAAEFKYKGQQDTDVLQHLRQVESDFLSPGNILCKGIQAITNKFCN